jgi:2'-5' RNA ligase
VRIFLGVAAGDAVAAAAGALSRELQARVTALAPQARASWVPPDRYHLTVLFIGRVDESQFEPLRAAFATPLHEPPFEIAIEGAGVFPTRGAPRAIWAGVTDGHEAFARVQREAYVRASQVVPLEPEREARPHLTLARVKEPGGLRASALLDGFDRARLGIQRVDAITVFESRPTGGGVQYLPLWHTALAE